MAYTNLAICRMLPLCALVFASALPWAHMRACQLAALMAVDCCLLAWSKGERPCLVFPEMYGVGRGAVMV